LNYYKKWAAWILTQDSDITDERERLRSGKMVKKSKTARRRRTMETKESEKKTLAWGQNKGYTNI